MYFYDELVDNNSCYFHFDSTSLNQLLPLQTRNKKSLDRSVSPDMLYLVTTHLRPCASLFRTQQSFQYGPCSQTSGFADSFEVFQEVFASIIGYLSEHDFHVRGA